MSDGTNHRTDQFGGNIENRFRVLREVCTAVIDAWDGDGRRVGVRLSPSGTFNDMADSDWMSHWTYIVRELDKLGLAYLHVVEPRIDGSADRYTDRETKIPRTWRKTWRNIWSGTLIGAGGYTRRTAEAALRNKDLDLVCFGRKFISNPDLPARFAAAARSDAGLREASRAQGRRGSNNKGFHTEEGEIGGEEREEDDDDVSFLCPYERETFYGGGAQGYTDYPFWRKGETS